MNNKRVMVHVDVTDTELLKYIEENHLQKAKTVRELAMIGLATKLTASDLQETILNELRELKDSISNMTVSLPTKPLVKSEPAPSKLSNQINIADDPNAKISPEAYNSLCAVLKIEKEGIIS